MLLVFVASAHAQSGVPARDLALCTSLSDIAVGIYKMKLSGKSQTTQEDESFNAMLKDKNATVATYNLYQSMIAAAYAKNWGTPQQFGANVLATCIKNR
jgi:hypothetical protein